MAPEANDRKRRRQADIVPPFHQRFNIELGSEEAQQRFTNRVRNTFAIVFKQARVKDMTLPWMLANKLGLEYRGPAMSDLDSFLSGDLYTSLEVLEGLYEFIGSADKRRFDAYMKSILSQSELDLGIQWRNGAFWPSGAELLDNALVNENLRWLSAPEYASALDPFEKGLRHFLEAQKRPGALSDSINRIYESLEALAKIVTGNDRDLSANAESFTSKLKLSAHYKAMLKSHISYANQYRHAAKAREERSPPLRNEVEAFVYTTGLFIRLAVQQLNATNPELQA